MNQTEPKAVRKRRSRRALCRGAEVLELCLVLMPFFSLFFMQLTLCYWIFAKVTLQQAVRRGARYGVTNDAGLLHCKGGGGDLTTCVKNEVQWAAGGLLSGSGRSNIKVHYCVPPRENELGDCVDVSGNADANTGNNIIEVSVENFSVAPLFPGITDWAAVPLTSPLVFSVRSADRIEPGGAPPPAGAAP